MSATAYLQQAAVALQCVEREQLDGIRRAAGLVVEAIRADRTLYSFGASHSFMVTEELVYRAGGLMLVNPVYPHGMNSLVRPITLTSRLERIAGLGAELLGATPAREGDVLFLASTSGRNTVVVDMAIAARAKGLKIVGITSLAYSGSVASRHPSGKKLAELCDVVLDNGAPPGDAVVAIRGFPQRVAPISSFTAIAIVNALVAEVVQRLVDAGVTPPVFMSANLDGGDAFNARLLAENRHRIHYLE